MKNVTILKIRMFLNILNIKYSILFLMLYFENITFKNYYFIHIYLYIYTWKLYMIIILHIIFFLYMICNLVKYDLDIL